MTEDPLSDLFPLDSHMKIGYNKIESYISRKENAMNYIKRDLETKITALSQEYGSIIVTGPRQVGKTTLLKQLMQP